MNIVVIDFETYWSTTHSLSKMLPLTYVMHPDTEIISAAIKVNFRPTEVYFGEKRVAAALECIDWDNTLAVAHNMSGFDAMILAWRFGVRPKMWGCTLAMARPIHSLDVGNSLAKLVAHYDLGVKDNSALLDTKGKHLADFTTDELTRMARYNVDDTDQCAALFRVLKDFYSPKELWHIDATIRMLVEPKFVLDTDLLEATLVKERNRKSDAVLQLAQMLELDILGDTALVEEEVGSQLRSAPKFSAILTSLNVPVPEKPSPTDPTRTVPALAKSDEEFLALTEHDNPIVATAARARLAVKSTLLETRIGAFLEAADAANGKFPVPLNYCGAVTTGRWSGWAYNPQNLPRVSGKLSDALRNCMCAPEGNKVVVADLSGIELRVNHFLWKVPSSMRLFGESPDKADLYKDFASRLYDVPVDQVSKAQRQIGKIAHLGLGFGAGPATFRRIAKMMGGVDITETEAMDVTYKWRDEYAPIVQGWRTCHDRIQSIHDGKEEAIDPWGLCVTTRGGIRLPSGRLIRYPNLHREVGADGKEEWWYGEGRHRARIYAGKVDENLVQALARDAMADYSFLFFQETGLRPSLLVHDEWVGVVPESKAQDALDILQRVMRTPLRWWPELVTWSEGDIAATYGEAK